MRDYSILTISLCGLLILSAVHADINDEEHNCSPSVARKAPKVSLTEEEMAAMDTVDPKDATSIYDFTVKDTFGNDVKMDKYTGNVVLIVNIASQCGLTKNNYEKLTQLNKDYHDKGLRIVNFPCNQFAGQMPEGNGEAMMCHLRDKNADIGDIMAKVNVNGDSAIPLYKYLKSQQGGFILDAIKWNFTKFLVDKTGHVVKRFSPTTDPMDIAKEIEALL